MQFSGVVDDLGPETSGRSSSEDGGTIRSLEVGDRVMGVTRFGAFSDRLNADVGIRESFKALSVTLQSSYWLCRKDMHWCLPAENLSHDCLMPISTNADIESNHTACYT